MAPSTATTDPPSLFFKTTFEDPVGALITSPSASNHCTKDHGVGFRKAASKLLVFTSSEYFKKSKTSLLPSFPTSLYPRTICGWGTVII